MFKPSSYIVSLCISHHSSWPHWFNIATLKFHLGLHGKAWLCISIAPNLSNKGERRCFKYGWFESYHLLQKTTKENLSISQFIRHCLLKKIQKIEPLVRRPPTPSKKSHPSPTPRHPKDDGCHWLVFLWESWLNGTFYRKVYGFSQLLLFPVKCAIKKNISRDSNDQLVWNMILKRFPFLNQKSVDGKKNSKHPDSGYSSDVSDAYMYPPKKNACKQNIKSLFNLYYLLNSFKCH